MEARFKIWDSVRIGFGGSKQTGEMRCTEGKILAIKFTSNKVFYDVVIPVDGSETVIDNVDSAFVESV